jgi:CheY-like chemotaxis protein/two-component sensor histidine kinase
MNSHHHAAEASGWYHDLRTATGQVLAYADLLATSKLSREQSLDGIRASCGMLLELLDGLYDEVLSNVTAEVSAEKSTRFEDLVSTVVDTFRATADVRAVRLAVRQAPALPDVSFRTNVVLKRVLANVVSNALRHTQRGEVLVSTGLEPSAKDPAMQRVFIEVKDNGIGMDRDTVLKYTQPNSAELCVTQRGRGLRTTLMLVESLGGRLTIKSWIGVGTIARVDFPLEALAGGAPNSSPHPSTAERALPAPESSSRRVLIIDDDAEIRQLVALALKPHGAIVTGHSRPDQLTISDVAPFDLVLLDANCGGFSGLAKAAELHMSGCRVPLAILSGTPAPPEGRLPLGVFRWLDKGAGLQAVLRLVRELFHTRTEYPDPMKFQQTDAR